MRLLVAHKILISAAVFLAMLLLVRGVRLYQAGGATSELAMGIAFGAVGVVLILYLRYIWHK